MNTRKQKQRGKGKTKTRTKATRQRGSSHQKQEIIQAYSDLLTLRSECLNTCAKHMCSTQNAAVCEQTQAFLKEKPAVDSSGFCNNMMAGFPQTCGLPSPSISPSCVCYQFRTALSQFEKLKARQNEWKPMVEELFRHINTPGYALSDQVKQFVRFKRMSGQRMLAI